MQEISFKLHFLWRGVPLPDNYVSFQVCSSILKHNQAPMIRSIVWVSELLALKEGLVFCKLWWSESSAESDTHTHTHTHTHRCIPPMEQIHTSHRNFTPDWPWSGRQHLCLLRWCVLTCVCSFNIYVFCVCLCASTHTLRSGCGWGAGCPPVSCHHWIWNALWQISSAESGEKWACPTNRREEEEESAAWRRAGSSLNSCLSNSPSTRKISFPSPSCD